jgi:putative nucleotidyltransferase with HDIG domain
VRKVLAGDRDASGDKWAAIVSTPTGPVLYTAGPLKDGDRIAGVVLVGSRLETFLPVVKGEALADIAVFDADGSMLATTFALSDPQDRVDFSRYEGRSPGDSVQGELHLYGRGFSTFTSDLRLRDTVIGRLGVSLSADYIASAGTTAQWQMSLLFAAVTLAVLGLGWLLARHLTRPLLRLVTAARAVAAGDLSARSAVGSRDEIGTLSVTFDSMAERLQRQHLATIGALVSAIDARDPYTAGHSIRVGTLSVELGRELGLASLELQHLQVGGYLHDVGKIGVRDSVLLKPSDLTAEERRAIEDHPRIGLDILAHCDLPPEVMAVVGRHHERLDGTGYPLGLTQDQLTIFPRITAVADVYDALTTDRPYRMALTAHEALAILTKEALAGKLDPDVVSRLRSIAGAWEEMRRSDPRLRGFRADKRGAA